MLAICSSSAVKTVGFTNNQDSKDCGWLHDFWRCLSLDHSAYYRHCLEKNTAIALAIDESQRKVADSVRHTFRECVTGDCKAMEMGQTWVFSSFAIKVCVQSNISFSWRSDWMAPT